MGASEQAKRWLKMQPRKMKVPIASLLPPSTPQLAIDLLEKMLEFDPHQRITAAACLRHPYFAGLANEANEQDCDRTFDWSFEKNGQLSCDQIKHLVWEQVVQFHPDLATQRHL
jgi:serine/threonine protein kinase